MNGELYQLSRLVLYVKDLMRSGKEKEFTLGKSENRLLFSFIPEKRLFLNYADKYTDALSWYKNLKKRGLKNIHLINNFEEDDISLAGYSNSAKQGIVTEYADGKKTIWIACWEVDRVIKAWKIYYKEYEFNINSNVTYTFAECSENFKIALLNIEKLARKLKFGFFAKIFKEAYDILTSEEDPLIPEWADGTMPDLKGEQLRLFLAASKADVFGGMGSWNDSPPYVAYEKGLQKDYDCLSRNLYNLTRKAVMNAVNS